MGDMGEMFNEYKKDRKQKKQTNLEKNTNLLEKNGITFEKKNGGTHLIINHNGVRADFWPSTGKYVIQNKYGRGVFKLLRELDYEPGEK